VPGQKAFKLIINRRRKSSVQRLRSFEFATPLFVDDKLAGWEGAGEKKSQHRSPGDRTGTVRKVGGKEADERMF
jgi:hypothetical protein